MLGKEKKVTGNGSDKDAVKNERKENTKKVFHKHEEVCLRERSASRKL